MSEIGAPVKKESQVKKELGRLYDNVDILEKALCDLEIRLTTVLRPDAPCSAAEAEKEVGYDVPLAEGLRVINKRIEALKFYTLRIQERCEL